MKKMFVVALGVVLSAGLSACGDMKKSVQIADVNSEIKSTKSDDAMSEQRYRELCMMRLNRMCDDGEYPKPTVPIRPTQPTSLDYSYATLQHARKFGINLRNVGKREWVDACEVNVYQSSMTVFSGSITENCIWQNSRANWVINNVKIQVLDNRNGRGSWSSKTMAGNSYYNAMDEVVKKYNYAIDAALKLGKRDLAAKLKLHLENLEKRVSSYKSSHNAVQIFATADANFWNSSRVHIRGRVELIRIN